MKKDKIIVDSKIINSETGELINGSVKEIFDNFGNECASIAYNKGIKNGLIIGSCVTVGILGIYIIVKKNKRAYHNKKVSLITDFYFFYLFF